MTDEEIEERVREFKDVAEAHWKWFEQTLHLIYVDAMVHGYRHRLKEEQLEKGGVQ